jgi:signal transduction histidine kinase
LRHGASLAIVPTVVADLCEEVKLAQAKHLEQAGIRLGLVCSVLDEWPLDRDLVGDILNNAVQNAGRHARSRVELSAVLEGGELVLRVEDDGPGFADPSTATAGGTGLLVGERLAALHVRRGRSGALFLSNGGRLGGAVFELRLP